MLLAADASLAVSPAQGRIIGLMVEKEDHRPRHRRDPSQKWQRPALLLGTLPGDKRAFNSLNQGLCSSNDPTDIYNRIVVAARPQSAPR